MEVCERKQHFAAGKPIVRGAIRRKNAVRVNMENHVRLGEMLVPAALHGLVAIKSGLGPLIEPTKKNPVLLADGTKRLVMRVWNKTLRKVPPPSELGITSGGDPKPFEVSEVGVPEQARLHKIERRITKMAGTVPDLYFTARLCPSALTRARRDFCLAFREVWTTRRQKLDAPDGISTRDSPFVSGCVSRFRASRPRRINWLRESDLNR